MCLIALAWRVHPHYPLVVAANRDEFHLRPAVALAEWSDAPGVVGGRDSLHGGGWLALRGSRLAAVTNVRLRPERDGYSRGGLVADFVRDQAEGETALRALAARAAGYRPFNLVLHDGRELMLATNTPEFTTRTLAAGVHGISNGGFDAIWPKVEGLTSRLDAWLRSAAAGDGHDAPDIGPLFEALAQSEVAPDERLPDTGVGPELERFLSPAFIHGETYGTRASTVVLIGEDHAEITECRFGPNAQPLGQTRMRVTLDQR